MRTLVFDATILNTLQLCARLLKLTFIDQKETAQKASYLAEGDVIHQMLHIYYILKKYQGRWRLNNRTYKDIVEICLNVGRYHAAKHELDFVESEHHFRDYCKMYEHEGFEILSVEQVGCREMYNDGDLQLIYQGKIDLEVSRPGIPRLPIDHKKHRQRNDPAQLSNQFMGYCWLTGSSNLMVNEIGFQKTLKPEERFRRHILSYPKDVINEWVENTVWWAKQLITHTETGIFPANFTSCDKYGGCAFRTICITEREVRQWKLERDFVDAPKWDVGAVL